MPKMGVNPEQTKAAKPVPSAWYKLRLKGMTCKMSKSQKGYNYEAYMVVVENQAEYNEAFILFAMNNGFRQAKDALDFCHGLGFPLEHDGSFPGDWTLKDPSKPGDFNGAQYSGVLLGKVMEAELTTITYEGNERNKVRQIRCKIPNCNTQFPDIRHQTNMLGKEDHQ